MEEVKPKAKRPSAFFAYKFVHFFTCVVYFTGSQLEEAVHGP